MNRRLIRFCSNKSGQTTAEYVLIVSAVAVALMVAFQGFSSQVGTLVSVSSALIH